MKVRLRNFFTKGLVEAGCDEAGRGCLAGPVYAAAVILPQNFRHPLLNDSKKLGVEERNELRLVIEKKALAWAVAWADHQEIDRINILNASFLAMHRAIDQLKMQPQQLLIDGNRFKPHRQQNGQHRDPPSDHANDEILKLAMIETKEALGNLDDIMSTPGLDGIYIGPADLSLAIGEKPSFDKPKDSATYKEITNILNHAKKNKIFAGIHNGTPEYAQEMLHLGFNLVTFGSDQRFMSAGAKSGVSKLKSIKAKAAEFDNVIELYNKLKTIRAEAGRKFNQLPEVICPDNVLKETAEAKPSSIQSLLKVKGFNQRMFNKFGEEILEAIKEFNSDREISKIPSELKRTFDLVQNRYKLEEISSALNLSDSIISMQIESILKFYPDLEISFLIDRKKIDKINEVLSTGLKDLKSIKEKLNGSVNYAEIRIVMAKQKLNY